MAAIQETFEIGQLVAWQTGSFSNTGIYKYTDDKGMAHIRMTFQGARASVRDVQVCHNLLSKTTYN